MGREILVLTSVLLGFLTLTSASAQSLAEVRVNEAGACPPDSILRGFPKVTQPSVGIGFTVVKFANATLDRAEASSEAASADIRFNSLLVVFGYSRDEKKLFVRTVPAKGNDDVPACGWVSVDNVLVPRQGQFVDRYKIPQPLQMRDISRIQDEAHNLLDVKAVVHDLSIQGESNGGIDVFEDPRNGNATDKIRLFDAFLVYDQMKVATASPNQETRYWLIGDRAASNGAVTLRGWIRQRDVAIWPSRLAVQWNEAATVAGYATPENLERKTAPLTLPERIDRADYDQQITRRLPVLEISPSVETLFADLPMGASLEERKQVARRILQYYKIATPGLACRRDNPADCFSPRQIDAQRQKIATAEAAAWKIDILILIDATESMDPNFPSTVSTIERFLKLTEDAPVRDSYDLHFGISLYGDYQDDESSLDKVDYQQIVPFFRPSPGEMGTSAALGTLVSNPKSLLYKDVHQDKLEAPFAAVIRAAQTAQWRPINEVPLRFIVHITDAGNRDPGKTCAETQLSRYPNAPENRRLPRSTNREVYGEQDVVNALQIAHVIYVPVEVRYGTGDLWNRIFQDQANSILSLLGTDAPVKKPVITDSKQIMKGPDCQKDCIDKQVTDTVIYVMKSVWAGFEHERCDSHSNSSTCHSLKNAPDLAKPEIVRLVDRIASAAAGLTSDEITNIYSRDQSIVTMYSPAVSADGADMFTHWVALERPEFAILRDLLKTLCDGMSEQDAHNPVLKALRELSEMYSNEDFTDLTVREILGKRLGIPNLEQTDFSGRTRDEIDDAYRAWQSGSDTKTWDNWHYRACKAMTFTQLMEDDQRINPADIKCDLKSNICEAPAEKRSKFRWSVEVSRGSPTFYVPLDIIP